MILNPKIELWEVPRLWADETVVCIAGGPSVTVAQVNMVYEAEIKVTCSHDLINGSLIAR